MNIYKITIQYKGTSFSGWQSQPDQKTVQGELNKALATIAKSNDIKTLGSGRTDAGVHALGQIVKVIMPLNIGEIELTRALNSLLPLEIQTLKVEKADDSFHPIQNAKWKEYVYLFSTDRDLSLFHKDYVTQFAYDLDLKKMLKACELFKGSHDFSDFQCVGTEVNSTVREIFDFELAPFSESWGMFPKTENILMLRVRGDGFLKQMVRLIVGTLWSVGQGKIELQELENALKVPVGRKLGVVAPPQGLYLNQVFY